jgi:hypothetical protein
MTDFVGGLFGNKVPISVVRLETAIEVSRVSERQQGGQWEGFAGKVRDSRPRIDQVVRQSFYCARKRQLFYLFYFYQVVPEEVRLLEHESRARGVLESGRGGLRGHEGVLGA